MAGNIGRRISRAWWGRGVATRALAPSWTRCRPVLFDHVAVGNAGFIRRLEKAGIRPVSFAADQVDGRLAFVLDHLRLRRSLMTAAPGPGAPITAQAA